MEKSQNVRTKNAFTPNKKDWKLEGQFWIFTK